MGKMMTLIRGLVIFSVAVHMHQVETNTVKTEKNDMNSGTVMYRAAGAYCSGGSYRFACDQPSYYIGVGQGLRWGVLSNSSESQIVCKSSPQNCEYETKADEFLQKLTERCFGRLECQFTVPEVTVAACDSFLSSYVYLLFNCMVSEQQEKPSTDNISYSSEKTSKATRPADNTEAITHTKHEGTIDRAAVTEINHSTHLEVVLTTNLNATTKTAGTEETATTTSYTHGNVTELAIVTEGTETTFTEMNETSPETDTGSLLTTESLAHSNETTSNTDAKGTEVTEPNTHRNKFLSSTGTIDDFTTFPTTEGNETSWKGFTKGIANTDFNTQKNETMLTSVTKDKEQTDTNAERNISTEITRAGVVHTSDYRTALSNQLTSVIGKVNAQTTETSTQDDQLGTATVTKGAGATDAVTKVNETTTSDIQSKGTTNSNETPTESHTKDTGATKTYAVTAENTEEVKITTLITNTERNETSETSDVDSTQATEAVTQRNEATTTIDTEGTKQTKSFTERNERSSTDAESTEEAATATERIITSAPSHTEGTGETLTAVDWNETATTDTEHTGITDAVSVKSESATTSTEGTKTLETTTKRNETPTADIDGTGVTEVATESKEISTTNDNEDAQTADPTTKRNETSTKDETEGTRADETTTERNETYASPDTEGARADETTTERNETYASPDTEGTTETVTAAASTEPSTTDTELTGATNKATMKNGTSANMFTEGTKELQTSTKRIETSTKAVTEGAGRTDFTSKSKGASTTVNREGTGTSEAATKRYETLSNGTKDPEATATSIEWKETTITHRKDTGSVDPTTGRNEMSTKDRTGGIGLTGTSEMTTERSNIFTTPDSEGARKTATAIVRNETWTADAKGTVATAISTEWNQTSTTTDRESTEQTDTATEGKGTSAKTADAEGTGETATITDWNHTATTHKEQTEATVTATQRNEKSSSAYVGSAEKTSAVSERNETATNTNSGGKLTSEAATVSSEAKKSAETVGTTQTVLVIDRNETATYKVERQTTESINPINKTSKTTDAARMFATTIAKVNLTQAESKSSEAVTEGYHITTEHAHFSRMTESVIETKESSPTMHTVYFTSKMNTASPTENTQNTEPPDAVKDETSTFTYTNGTEAVEAVTNWNGTTMETQVGATKRETPAWVWIAVAVLIALLLIAVILITSLCYHFRRGRETIEHPENVKSAEFLYGAEGQTLDSSSYYDTLNETPTESADRFSSITRSIGSNSKNQFSWLEQSYLAEKEVELLF